MATSGGDVPAYPQGEGADWDALVRKCARQAAHRHRVADWADDLAQEVHVRSVKAREAAERVNLGWIRRVASSIAGKESRRRRKEAQVQRRVADEASAVCAAADNEAVVQASKGIPELCPALARLIEPGRDGRLFQRLILVAALRCLREIVGTKRGSGRRYMLFRAAYEDRERIESLATKFKKRPEAITEQLRRLSGAVERYLMSQLDLPTHVAAAIAAKTADAGHVGRLVRRAIEAFLI